MQRTRHMQGCFDSIVSVLYKAITSLLNIYPDGDHLTPSTAFLFLSSIFRQCYLIFFFFNKRTKKERSTEGKEMASLLATSQGICLLSSRVKVQNSTPSIQLTSGMFGTGISVAQSLPLLPKLKLEPIVASKSYSYLSSYTWFSLFSSIALEIGTIVNLWLACKCTLAIELLEMQFAFGQLNA